MSLNNNYTELKNICKQIRKDIITMIYHAGSGHPGGSLSLVEIMVALYFGGILNYKPDKPDWSDRDRLVLSKGHAAPVLYAVLAKAGYFPQEDLNSLRKIDSYLQGHPHNLSTPGVEVPTGSLGQGLSIAHGIALGLRVLKNKARVFAIVGDGELEEGSIWETAMSAGYYRSGNLTAIIDYNHLQIDGNLNEVKSPEPITDKFAAFNWQVVEVDGHDLPQLLDELSKPINHDQKPKAIIAHTVKGKGISFMENVVDWHGVAPNQEQYQKAMEELNG
ncbi:MAG: transketolase [Desulfuromonas sp. SDB]|nr:MAG: transketolase [Desulfuromonas sp. SDB]